MLNSLEQTIHAAVLRVARKLSPSIEEVRNDDHLNQDLGLKSLDLARLVVILERKLKTDPFQETPITRIRTVADLIEAYRSTLAGCGKLDTSGQQAAERTAQRRSNAASQRSLREQARGKTSR